jgi:integrase
MEHEAMTSRSKTTRGRSRHPGVVLRHRSYASGRTAWVARYRDPWSGQDKDITLDGPELGLTTHEARRDWAVRLSRQLAEQRAAMRAGERPLARVAVGDAIETYYATRAGRLRERTVGTYRVGSARLLDWCQRAGVRMTDDLTGPRLVAFRDALASAPRFSSRLGGRRGAQRATATLRSPVTVNRDMTSVRAMINTWRRQGLVRLTRDDIADALRPFPELRVRPQPLKQPEIRALLEAALRHDADTYTITRAEKAGEVEPGTTPRHEPVAPLVLFTLLSGCRIGEVSSLTWDNVDLAAHEGQGEIVVQATACKTGIERAVRLDVSPALRPLLAALRLRAGADPHVFGGVAPLSEDRLKAAQRRLVGPYKAPEFNWQRLRQTCGTFLTNAPGVFGAASAFMSARRLGHAVAVAERHYLGVVSVPAEAKTLEAAMQIEDLADRIVAAVGTGERVARQSA